MIFILSGVAVFRPQQDWCYLGNILFVCCFRLNLKSHLWQKQKPLSFSINFSERFEKLNKDFNCATSFPLVVKLHSSFKLTVRSWKVQLASGGSWAPVDSSFNCCARSCHVNESQCQNSRLAAEESAQTSRGGAAGGCADPYWSLWVIFSPKKFAVKFSLLKSLNLNSFSL